LARLASSASASSGRGERGGQFLAGLPGQRGQAFFAAVHDDAVAGGSMAAQGQEFRHDLAVFRPGEAFPPR
jgi:hypothetical protein